MLEDVIYILLIDLIINIAIDIYGVLSYYNIYS